MYHLFYMILALCVSWCVGSEGFKILHGVMVYNAHCICRLEVYDIALTN